MSQRRLRGWQPPLENINSLIASGGPRLLARSRELVVTNGYAANACEAFASNLVGDGIKPSSLLEDPALRDRVQRLWLAWTDEADADGLTDFYGLQAMVAREMFVAGECFVRLRPRRAGLVEFRRQIDAVRWQLFIPRLGRAGVDKTLDATRSLPDYDEMTVFATEFPVKSNVNRAAFVSEIIAWLRGTRYSTVLSSAKESDLDEANALLRSPSGEELRVRELRQDGVWNAIGFRHDFPDGEGRLWRTEGVLKRSPVFGEQDLIRLRTQCFATNPGANLESPRKPYLIKGLLKNGWGGTDATFTVSDQPIWLEDNQDGLNSARAVIAGDASKSLPTLYISATGKGLWLFEKRAIEKLAFDLGGVAHVVVEPDRAFSFRLRDECAGRNAYGGTVALAVPNQGIVRRYYLGWQIRDATELAATLREAASRLRVQMPTLGWDWTELQEQVLRAQRVRDKARLTAAESEQLYQEEIENLQDRIRELEQRLAARPNDPIGTDDGEFSTDNLVRLIGPEVYSGEISDRLRLAAKLTLLGADNIGLDSRTKKILQRIVDRLSLSPALSELLQDIGRATKDPKRLAGELTTLLLRHGYREKSDNKHIRLEATKGYDGLAAITIPKTPSEHRGLKNLRSQVEGTLGLTDLTKK